MRALLAAALLAFGGTAVAAPPVYHPSDYPFPFSDAVQVGNLLISHEVAVTIEEASIGGFGAHVLTLASDAGLLDGGLIDGGLKLRTMRLPDRFQDHDNPAKQYDEAGLTAPHIVETVLKALRHNDVGVKSEAGAIA